MRRVLTFIVTLPMLGLFALPHLAHGQEHFVGEIKLVGFNFCPRGFAAADGQLLQISTNSALFSLFGITYGGDGRTTFALPDLRGRVPIHVGQGPGLGNRVLGEEDGEEAHILTVDEHPHTLTHSMPQIKVQQNLPQKGISSPLSGTMSVRGLGPKSKWTAHLLVLLAMVSPTTICNHS